MYEDTDFLPRRPKSGRSARDHTESFAPYEDTDYLPRRKSPDKTEGLFRVYQDTEFLDGRGKPRRSPAAGNDTQGFGELYQASPPVTLVLATVPEYHKPSLVHSQASLPPYRLVSLYADEFD